MAKMMILEGDGVSSDDYDRTNAIMGIDSRSDTSSCAGRHQRLAGKRVLMREPARDGVSRHELGHR